MLAARARAAGCYVVLRQRRGRPGRAGVRRPEPGVRPDGALVARAKQFEEELLIVDLDLEAPRAARALERRRRHAESRRRSRRLALDIITVERPAAGAAPAAQAKRRSSAPSPRPPRRAGVARRRRRPVARTGLAPTPVCDCLSVEGEVYAALCLGVRDYVRKNGFQQVVMGISGGIDSALTACIAADALGQGQGQRRLHALALLQRRHQDRRARDRRAPGGRTSRRSPSRPSTARTWRRSAPYLRRRAARRDRAEHPGAHPRQHPHGAVEQVRLPGAHHRQQERDGGRLRHALRRHGRRLRRAQGRPQDPGLPAGRVPQLRSVRARAHPADDHRPGAFGRARRRPDRPGHPAALRPSRPHHRGLRGERRERGGDRGLGHRPGRGAAGRWP